MGYSLQSGEFGLPNVVISNKHGTYGLPHKLQNDLRLRILGFYERSE